MQCWLVLEPDNDSWNILLRCIAIAYKVLYSFSLLHPVALKGCVCVFSSQYVVAGMPLILKEELRNFRSLGLKKRKSKPGILAYVI